MACNQHPCQYIYGTPLCIHGEADSHPSLHSIELFFNPNPSRHPSSAVKTLALPPCLPSPPPLHSVAPPSSAVLTGVSSSGAVTSDVTSATINPFCTINVKTHVPNTLELNRPNFTRWSAFFKAMIRKFGLPSFLDPAIPARPGDPTWEQTDYAIKGWLYTSVDDFIVALAMDNPDLQPLQRQQGGTRSPP
jgi:hypothetical protein